MKQNPLLEPLAFLIGEWDVELSNILWFEDKTAKLRGVAKFDWLDNGFITMRTEMEGAPPGALSILASNTPRGTLHMIYYDERGVSRLMDMTFDGTRWIYSRDDPDFAQRSTAVVSPDRTHMHARVEKAMDHKTWETDFEMEFRKR